VQPDQIVVREVKRDRRLQVLQLLAEGAGEAGKTPLVLFVADREGREMMFTIEFFAFEKRTTRTPRSPALRTSRLIWKAQG
jgi:hypothetical protein